MSEVKKYDSYGYDGLSGIMKEHPDGEWVRVENYELAVMERNAALAECERLSSDLRFLAESESRGVYWAGRIDAALSAKPNNDGGLE